MSNIKWIPLNSPKQIEEIKNKSLGEAIIIFKHSTRCSISGMVLNRLERSWDELEMQKVTPYFLDLITYREISNKIADEFKVYHESPQILVIKNGECSYDDSHMSISYQTVKNVI